MLLISLHFMRTRITIYVVPHRITDNHTYVIPKNTTSKTYSVRPRLHMETVKYLRSSRLIVVKISFHVCYNYIDLIVKIVNPCHVVHAHLYLVYKKLRYINSLRVKLAVG